MDKYKITQSSITKRIPRPIKNALRSKRQGKTLDTKMVIAVAGGALGVIAIGALTAIIVNGHSTPKAKQPSGSLPAISKNTSAGIPPATYNALTAAITSKNVILGSYCTPKVHIIIVKSGVNETLDCADADKLVNGGISGAVNPWNFHVPESDIAAWQTGPYGQYFTGTNLVGESSDGEVISIGFNGSGQITTVIVAPVGSLTATNSSTASSTSQTTSNSSTGSATTPPNNYIPPNNPTPTGAID